MTKPKLKTKKYLDYFEIKDYIIEKYNCEKDEDKTWDYMCNKLEIRNDTYSYIPTLNCVNEFTKYHFSTDYDAFHDESHYTIKLERQDIPNPQLYIKQNRCPQGKFCSEGSKEWQYIFIEKKIILQLNSILNKFC